MHQTIFSKPHPTDAYFEDTIESIRTILRFDSSKKPAVENCPFGKETAECLQAFLDLASSLGFETVNYDNYVGEVRFGTGKDFAVLAHLDVVPAGSGWTYPPFGAIVNDDVSKGGVTGKKIWGRGAMDDKGPAVCCLYALYALKKNGFTPNRTIKLIVGCNEECGWECIDHYKKVARMPDEGFTPDAEFPAIYAEKGILHVTTKWTLANAPFRALEGGERVNMVCDRVQSFVPKHIGQGLLFYKNKVAGTDFTYDNSTNVLRFTGKSAHGSTPALGANALQSALAYFATFDNDCAHAYNFLFGEATALTKMQDETGVLTLSPNVVRYKDGVLSVSCDVRFPATKTKEEVLSHFDKYGVAYSVDNYQAPLYNDPNGKLIQTLMKVYNDTLQTDEKPVAIGGGTYARALKCGVAFGPEMLGEEVTIHQPDEYITLDRIKLLNRLYYDALKALTK